jgi:hypothetical protein
VRTRYALSLAKTPQRLNVHHVTCYTPSLYVIHFKGALNSGEARGVHKAAAGRELDGRTYDEMPSPVAAGTACFKGTKLGTFAAG